MNTTTKLSRACLLLLLLTAVAAEATWQKDAFTLSRTCTSQTASFSGWDSLGQVQRNAVQQNLDDLLSLSRQLVSGWMHDLVEQGLSSEEVAALWGKLKKVDAELKLISGERGRGAVTTATAREFYAVELKRAAKLFSELAELFGAVGL